MQHTTADGAEHGSMERTNSATDASMNDAAPALSSLQAQSAVLGESNAAAASSPGQGTHDDDVQLCTSRNYAYVVSLWAVCCCV
jgi:hypothetical protein